MDKGLEQTASLWPQITTAYTWVHRAAHLLGNKDKRSTEDLRAAYAALLEEISSFAVSPAPSEAVSPASCQADPSRAGATGATGATEATALLSEASLQFVKVSKSYGEGLFACYRVPGLPPTNNDLEQFFGSARYHERRVSGRKSAAPGTVVRGSVRLVAAVATRARVFSAEDLRPRDLGRWRTLRQDLEQRHESRRKQRRFRRDPEAFLAGIEEELLKSLLPT